jgi:hypothetical protein
MSFTQGFGHGSWVLYPEDGRVVMEDGLSQALKEVDPSIESVKLHLGFGGGHVEVVPDLNPVGRERLKALLQGYVGQSLVLDNLPVEAIAVGLPTAVPV